LKEHWKIILGFLSGIIIFTAIIVPLSIYYRNERYNASYNGFIRIEENIHFANYGFPGSGTEADPYLIENFHFTHTSNAIFIKGTTCHFIIQNCFISSSYIAINLKDIIDCSVIIQNNTCIDNSWGIALSDSNSIIVQNNTCRNNGCGMEITSSSNIMLSENCLTNNSMSGLYSVISNSNTITNNEITYNRYGLNLDRIYNYLVINNTCSYNTENGIYLVNTNNCSFENNTLRYNRLDGFLIHYSNDNSLIGNDFFACGLRFNVPDMQYYFRNIIVNNSINNKLLGFFINLRNETFSNPIYGQLIFLNCSGLTIENQNLSSTSIGLLLYFCTNSSFSNNICSNNTRYGISTKHSSNMIYTNNTCNNNIGEYLYYVTGTGIHLYNSSFLLLINNTCSRNYMRGISIFHVNNATLLNNTCNSNGIGLYLSYSDSCIITHTLFDENSSYAVYASYSSSNVIHHNNFIDNNLNGSRQAYDSYGGINLWYDNATFEGNYWSDWNGFGSYTLYGSTQAADLYPLSSPVIIATCFSKALLYA